MFKSSRRVSIREMDYPGPRAKAGILLSAFVFLGLPALIFAALVDFILGALVQLIFGINISLFSVL